MRGGGDPDFLRFRDGWIPGSPRRQFAGVANVGDPNWDARKSKRGPHITHQCETPPHKMRVTESGGDGRRDRPEWDPTHSHRIRQARAS